MKTSDVVDIESTPKAKAHMRQILGPVNSSQYIEPSQLNGKVEEKELTTMLVLDWKEL